MPEWLADHRAVIAQAGQFFDLLQVFRPRRRHDAVDHGRGEAHIVGYPAGERLVGRLGEA
ncbi:hypothetical protein ABUE29_05630 [Mesorhizobium sp. ZMM04-4]